MARRPLPAHAKLARTKLVHTRADLRDDAAREALAGVDVLFHLGFALWRGRDSADRNGAARIGADRIGADRNGADRNGADRNGADLNWDGTRNILAARPARVVLASSAAVYGAWPDNPLPITEDHWPRPNRQCRYAVDKLRAERLCESSAPTLVLRIGAVLGPHADPRVARAVHGYRLGVPAFRGEKGALQFLDEQDAAAALHRAGASVATGVVNIAPADWLSAPDVARLAGSRVVPLPGPLLLAASEAAFRLHLTPFGADRAILVHGPLALDPTRAAGVLGWTATKTSAQVLSAALRR